MATVSGPKRRQSERSDKNAAGLSGSSASEAGIGVSVIGFGGFREWFRLCLAGDCIGDNSDDRQPSNMVSSSGVLVLMAWHPDVM